MKKRRVIENQKVYRESLSEEEIELSIGTSESVTPEYRLLKLQFCRWCAHSLTQIRNIHVKIPEDYRVAVQGKKHKAGRREREGEEEREKTKEKRKRGEAEVYRIL